MRVILDIATLLGGIAALWFFWEKFNSFRINRLNTAGEKSDQFASLDSPFWQILLMIAITAFSCAAAATTASFALIRLGYWGVAIAIIVSIICLLIGAGFEGTGREHVGFPILLGSGCMMWAAVIGMIVSVIVSLYTRASFAASKAAATFVIVSGIIGGVFGFLVSYGAYRHAREASNHPF